MKFLHLHLSLFFCRSRGFFQSSLLAKLHFYRFTRSHLGAGAQKLLDTEHEEVKCLWTRRCSVPSSIIYQSQPPSLFKCSVRLGVQQPRLTLISHSPTDVCGECCGSCCCRAAYWKPLWSSDSFAKIELCLTPSLQLTEAWNCAKLSAHQQLIFYWK